MPATLKSRLPLIAAELRPKVSAAVKASAELIEARAKVRVHDRPPIGVGLVAAIHTEREGAAGYRVVAGNNDAWYGHLLEHGTSHSAPYPFLVPALEESTEEALALVRAALTGL
jgi:HK97 gp10 family phage protein